MHAIHAVVGGGEDGSETISCDRCINEISTRAEEDDGDDKRG